MKSNSFIPDKIDRNNILVIFSYFKDYIVKKSEKQPEDIVESFFVYLSEQGYDIAQLTGTKDKIFEEEYRRRTGSFYTPTIWADYVHKIIEGQFGKDWKNDYVVWDPCCGTANLTRGFKFNELYLSTIEQHDIDIIKSCGYNQEANIFQYDFLSESGLDSIPQSLKDAINNKRVIALVNPPYGTSGNMKIEDGNSKKGIAKNPVNKEMISQKLGLSSRNLYCQFFYKLAKYNLDICFFSPSNYLTGPGNKKFREQVLSEYIFLDGMMFQASHFSDVANQWAVSFVIWKHGSDKKFSGCELKIADIDFETFQIKNFGKKTLAAPNILANHWAKKEVKNIKTIDSPMLSSCVSVKEKGYGKNIENSIGYFCNHNNAVYDNAMGVALFTAASTKTGGQPIIPENIRKVVALFTARKTIKRNWINYQDEYFVPNESHPDYPRWVNDCFVYALFGPKCNQSSLRGIEYKGKQWDIINHFFPFSKDFMMNLAEENNFEKMIEDIKNSENRYIYNYLKEISLSDDARNILNKAKGLVSVSMPLRKERDKEFPEYHLYAWDAGWAQLKPILKGHYKDEYKSFKNEFKEFEIRMREGVFKFGFLPEQ